tara:strand:- start:390 stop:623 length:234 start_codon:yes stop_codon:yes gene_type:complete
MPSHYGNSMEKKPKSASKDMRKKKMSKMDMEKLSDAEYYKEHSKHHSAKHIKFMKELQKNGVDRQKSHDLVKKYLGK